tara:strand:- start:2870 stop:3328 length:459 start_codon:yes stop_codon:yes gene_type:complete
MPNSNSTQNPYLRNFSPVALKPEQTKLIIKELQKEGYTPYQTFKSLEEIDLKAMDYGIKENHPDSLIRDVAGNPDLSLREKEKIYGLAHGAEVPSLRKKLILDSDNPLYSRRKRKAGSLPLGMSIVSLDNLIANESFSQDGAFKAIRACAVY